MSGGTTVFIREFIRRSVEVIPAVLIFLLSLPAMLVVSLLIAILMGRPIFFRQVRIGLNNRRFKLLKFRTMRADIEGRGAVTDGERLTTLGRWLRKASLDELPQLWNVIRGDMRFVGPRPLLPEYLPRYSASQRRRHEVKPGITGWAQVNGRNAITWDRRLELDVWYVDHRSLSLDLRILWMTVTAVLHRDGITQAGHATMPEFRGTPEQA